MSANDAVGLREATMLAKMFAHAKRVEIEKDVIISIDFGPAFFIIRVSKSPDNATRCVSYLNAFSSLRTCQVPNVIDETVQDLEEWQEKRKNS